MNYAVCGDIHLGHLKTPTKHIISSFKQSILTEKNKTLDVLFIDGDLFDRLLDFNSSDVHQIVVFFNQLLTYCHINNIILRILEGTPSHDWCQSQVITKLNEIRKHPCDLKYFKVLDVEYIESLNKYILYIPDEWVNDHKLVEQQIQEKFHQFNISKVDIAILHGQFTYQLIGKNYNGFHYNEDYFLSIVKGFIHIGHYHMFSTYDRIIATGSLERLAHGEEHPKGYVLVENDNYSFIENTNAYIYKTINITTAHTLDKLDKQILKYPKESFIRLSMNKDHPFNTTFQDLKLRYLDYRLKKLIKEHVAEKNKATHILSDTQIDLSGKFYLDTDIYQMLLTSILSKNQLNPVEEELMLDYTSIFKENVNAESLS